MYIYENHMGGLFVSDQELSNEECYCETCGDFDWFIGEASTKDEFLNLVKDENGSIMYSKEYIQNFLKEHF